jgi:hypothetical protein
VGTVEANRELTLEKASVKMRVTSEVKLGHTTVMDEFGRLPARPGLRLRMAEWSQRSTAPV